MYGAKKAYPYIQKALAYQPSPFLSSGTRRPAGSFHRSRGQKRPRSNATRRSGKRFKGRKGYKRVSKRFALSIARGLTAPNFYVWNQGIRISQTAGKQAWFCPGADTSTNGLDFLCGTFDLGAIGGKVSSNWNTRSQQFFLENAEQVVHFTNQGSAPIQLERYNCVCRKDLQDVIFGSDDTNQPFSVALAQWSATQNFITTGDLTSLGVDLFQIRGFVDHFKVLSKKLIQLGPGESISMKLRCGQGRKITSTYEGDDLGKLVATAGLTYLQVFKVYGLPSNDSTTKTSATVTSGQVQLDYIMTRRYTYTFVQDIESDMFGVNNLPASFAVAQDVMNEDTAAPGAWTNA